MAIITTIEVNGVVYDVYDDAAHKAVARIQNAMPADLQENAQGRLVMIDGNGNQIGEGAEISAKVDDLIIEQEGDENKLYLAYQGETIGDGVVLPSGGGGGDISGLKARMTAAESDISSLESRMTAAEAGLTDVIGDVYNAQQDIIALDGGKESVSNKVMSISSSSTDTQYPSAKAVYSFIQSLDGNGVAY